MWIPIYIEDKPFLSKWKTVSFYKQIRLQGVISSSSSCSYCSSSNSFIHSFLPSFFHSLIHPFIQDLCAVQGLPCLKTALHVPVSIIFFSLYMISHSPSYSKHPSTFRSSFLCVPSGFYSRIRGNIFSRTLCIQRSVNCFYRIASNIFLPTSVVALMLSFRNFPFPDLVKDPLRYPLQLHAVY